MGWHEGCNGRGMDVARIVSQAISKGLIDEAHAAELDEQRGLQLICLPG